MKRLIVNADDFGLCSGVNRGIIQCHDEGVLTSASLMVNMPGFDEAVELARAHPGLDLGVHITLAAGRPTSPAEAVASLVDDDGAFFPRRTLMARLLTRQVRRAHIECEVRAQVERFYGTGLTASHINGDQHVHILPPIAAVVVHIAKELRIAVRIPAERIFWTGPSNEISAETLLRFPIKLCLRPLCRTLRVLCHHHRIPTNDHFVSLFGMFPSGKPSSKQLIRLISSVSTGTTELMVHPAVVEDELVTFWQNNVSLAEERQAELYGLISSRFKDSLKSSGLKLISYSHLIQCG